MDRIIGQWQLGAILRMATGSPLTLSSALSTISGGSATPYLLGKMPEGKITFNTDGSLPNFFASTKQTTAAADPQRSYVTGVDTLSAAYSSRAILDENGNVLLINPQPGDPGGLGLRTIRGPGRFELDANLVKQVRVDDKRSMEFRADVVNILNHPVFSSPNVSINSASWGQISSTANESRRFTDGRPSELLATPANQKAARKSGFFVRRAGVVPKRSFAGCGFGTTPSAPILIELERRSHPS